MSGSEPALTWNIIHQVSHHRNGAHAFFIDLLISIQRLRDALQRTKDFFSTLISEFAFGGRHRLTLPAKFEMKGLISPATASLTASETVRNAAFWCVLVRCRT